MLKLIRMAPWQVLLLPMWLCTGLARLKRRIAGHVQLDPASLPYYDEVVTYVRQQKQEGRTVVLASATDESIARSVADHLGCFDQVIASDGKFNRRADEKVKAIRQQIGQEQFDYIGDSRKDLPVWRAATDALVVNPGSSLLKRLRAIKEPTHIFARQNAGSALLQLILAMRPNQWAKNLLMVVPMVMAHEIANGQLWVQLTLGFVAFSFCASSVYILNDLLDLDADRAHPSKKCRPLASGRLWISHGFVAAPALLLIGIAVAGAMSEPYLFLRWLVAYLILTFSYSLYLKQKMIVDVLVLAGLYTIRIVAGGQATGLFPTEWLMAFAMFMFLSLAFAKRYAELRRLETEARTHAEGRGYRVEDLAIVGGLGASSGYLAVLVFILYLNESEDVRGSPLVLMLISPILFYWISRLWILARRGHLREDPVLFTLTDRVSYACGALVLMVLLIAKFA